MTKSFNEYIGLKLKKARESTGLTQKDVNDRMGMKRTWVSDVERGKNAILFEDMVRLCKIYGLDMNEFIREATKEDNNYD